MIGSLGYLERRAAYTAAPGTFVSGTLTRRGRYGDELGIDPAPPVAVSKPLAAVAVTPVVVVVGLFVINKEALERDGLRNAGGDAFVATIGLRISLICEMSVASPDVRSNDFEASATKLRSEIILDWTLDCPTIVTIGGGGGEPDA